MDACWNTPSVQTTTTTAALDIVWNVGATDECQDVSDPIS